ncbi:MAG: sodium:solute symporter [Sedimentisphaeraceae bacterium JB056]
MTILGLHIIDVLIIVFYMFGMLYIGQRLSKQVSGETDFYLAGRKLGKLYQFFLMFGGATDANGAATVAAEVFRQGVSGVWIGLQMMFATPFYWFYNVWFRRVRLISMADLFEDRFNNKKLAAIFAVYAILLASTMVGFGYLAAGKTMQAMLIKSPEKYTATESQMIAEFSEYNSIKEKITSDSATEAEIERYDTLENMHLKGQLKGYVSYLGDTPIFFYILYGAIVAFYVICGGFRAAVVTNLVQGLLIIVFSIILIPFGLAKLGGFTGLHAAVPSDMFDLFGSSSLSEYNWFSISSMILLVAVSVNGGYANMAGGGSAKDEYSARVGVVTGAFGKRFMMMAWALAGLIAFGLFKDQIADPDQTWGYLSKSLLGTGILGVMIAGILAANMSSMDSSSLCISALFVRNLYTPIFPDKSEKHYVFVGRVVIFVILTLGLFVAVKSTGIISLMKVLLALPVAFGSVVMLIFFWRKLTVAAIYTEVISFLLIFVALPAILVQFDSFKRLPAITVQSIAETDGGVNAIFFDKVAKADSDDPDSVDVGIGRFNIEVYIASIMGFPVENFSRAGLLGTRFLVNIIFPFVVLILVSLFTKTPDKQILDRFYVRMKTPIAPTLEEDEIEVQKSYEMPHRFDHKKLFPKSSWEFCKWTKTDTYGFILCWIATGVIVWMFMWILGIGA